MLHTHLHLRVALTERTVVQSLGTFQESNALSEMVEIVVSFMQIDQLASQRTTDSHA
jgi:hypothetical protein